MISKKEMEKLPDFLLTKLNKDYSQEEVIRILEGYKTKRILSFRVNTIKTTAEEIEQELIKNEIKYERVKWSKDAFIVLNKKENEIQEMDIYKNEKRKYVVIKNIIIKESIKLKAHIRYFRYGSSTMRKNNTNSSAFQ